MAGFTISKTVGLAFASFILSGCQVGGDVDLGNRLASSAPESSKQSVQYSNTPRASESAVLGDSFIRTAEIVSGSFSPSVPGDWSLVFEDDFTGNSLDPNKWRLGGHHLGIAGMGANNSNNVVVRQGNVELLAEKTPSIFGSREYDFSGAEISTYQMFNQAYGFFEAKMKYDAVQGVWPAFWLMPDRGDYGYDIHHHESFLRFNIDDYSQPVSSALLKVRVTEVDFVPGNERNSDKVNYNLSVHKLLSDNWDEKTVTWNTRPVYDPLWIRQLSASVNGPALINEITVGQDIVIDITDYVNAQIADNGQVSVALVDTFRKQKQITLGSKESVNYDDQPRLEIDGNMLTASDDAYVRAGDKYADVNYGDQSDLVIKSPWNNTSAIDDDGMEIDIMESLGIWGEDRTQHAMHWDYYGRNHPNADSQTLSLQSTNDGYHVYGMNWQPGKIDFYVDGVKTWEHETDRVSQVASYMLLSQQLGGWAGNANIDAGFEPATLFVDYVRVWSGTASE
ncbi:MAG: family 16 glycosylhydrolase [Gammaproteobacteria bacterium]